MALRPLRLRRGTDVTDVRRMPPALSEALMEHSPRLIIARPTLVREPDSPTGWLLVIPGTEDEVAEAEDRRRRRRAGSTAGPARTPADRSMAETARPETPLPPPV